METAAIRSTTEEHLFSLLMQAPVAIAIYRGPNFVVELANDRMIEFYGKPREEIINRPIFEVFPEVAAHGVEALHRKVYETGERVFANEQKHEYYKNGKLYNGYFNTVFEPLRNLDNNIIGIIVTGHEVTEEVTARKKIEESEKALKEKNSELQEYLDNATIGLHWVNADGIIIWANKTEMDLLGYSKDEYIGHHIAEFHADQNVINDVLTRLANHETLNHYEAQMVCKDGSLRDVIINSNVLWEEDKFIHTRCFTHNVTEKKLAEKKIEESEKQHTFLLKLSDALRPLSNPVDIEEAATKVALDFMDADRCYYCTIEDDNVIILQDASREDLPSVAGVHSISGFALYKTVLDAGRPFVIDDVRTSPMLDEDLKQVCLQYQYGSFINVPVIKNSKAVGLFSVVQNTPRKWTDVELQLTIETAERTWAAVERAKAEGALRKSEERFRELSTILEQKVQQRTAQLEEKNTELHNINKELQEANLQVAISKYNKRFLTEFSDKFSTYKAHDELFNSLVLYIADLTKIDYILIGKIEEKSKDEFAIQTIAISAFGKLTDNINYPLPDGPCEQVTRGTLYSYPENCRVTFPKNQTLVQFNVEGYIGYPLFNTLGDAVGLIAVMHESAIADPETVTSILKITARRAEIELERIGYEQELEKNNKELEAKNITLAENESRIQTIFEAAPDAVITMDHHGIITAWNEEAGNIFGWEKNEVLGRPLAEIIIPERYREQHKNGLKNFMRTGEGKLIGKPIEIAALKKDNSEIPVELKISTSVVNNNPPVFIGFVRDISSRKKSENEIVQKNKDLQNMNKELEAFTYISSHDMQEPLRKIQTFAGRIMQKEEQHLSDTAKDYFIRMSNAATRMQTLIQDLLAFSRVRTSERKFEIINLTQLIDEVIDEFKEAIELRHGSIVTDEMCELNEVNIIAFQFRQLFYNLFSNALKFSKPDEPPLITVKSIIVRGDELNNKKLIPEKKYFHISVSDNGIGFEKQFSEKIFEVFQKLHGKELYSGTGTGIGLAIVKKIVDNHDGIISAESELGKGATFNIYLPVK